MKKFVGYITDKNYDLNNPRQEYGIPSSYIVRRLNIKKNSSKYVIRIACLGVYTFYVNGKQVNFDFMTQDVSEYSETITYRDYDITEFIRDGVNSIGFVVSDGWYSSNLSGNGKFTGGPYPDKIYYEVRNNGEIIAVADGSEVASDGAIRATDNQNGIIIDNNYDLGNFSDPNYDLSKFNKVNVYKVSAKLKKSIIPPVVEECRLKGKLIKQHENEFTYDFKQNLTGVVRAVFKGHKGDKVEIFHGEVLTRGKTLYRDNYRAAQNHDTFILKDDQEIEYFPHHVFRGFRYCKLVITGNVEIKEVEAVHFWTKLKRTGKIKTDNKLVNKIYSNIIWGQRDNFLSIPTDCPQRDERMGWTGDAQIFSGSAMCSYDSEKFLTNYVHIMMDSMDKFDDRVPVFTPYWLYRLDMMPTSMGWSDAIIIIPYYLYVYYGNTKVLKEALPYMKRYQAYVREHCVKDDIIDAWAFNDWLSVFEMCDVGVYNNSYYAFDTHLLSKICHILGDKDEKFFEDISKKVIKLSREKYIGKDGKITGDTQGAYVLATEHGICTNKETKDHLLRKVNEFGHLTTGFHSTKYLLRQLCDNGNKDVAYKLLNRKEYPSWGYMIECGGTTIWERWDSYRKDIGFNSDGMNSFNHYSLGAVIEWMYQYMMGIRPVFDDPAFKTTVISPYFDKSVSKANCSMKTKSGMVKVKYQIIDNEVTYYVKAAKKIKLDFKFNNQIISKTQIGDNEYEFKLIY